MPMTMTMSRRLTMTRRLPLSVLLAASVLGLTGCDEQEPKDWIEVPLGENTYFNGAGEYRHGEYDILVLSNSALEYKLALDAGNVITYTWEVDMAQPELLTAEFHGHTEREGDAPGAVMFYKVHNDGRESGALVAPFDGIHGWYLKNDSDDDIVVRLSVSGFYDLVD